MSVKKKLPVIQRNGKYWFFFLTWSLAGELSIYAELYDKEKLRLSIEINFKNAKISLKNKNGRKKKKKKIPVIIKWTMCIIKLSQKYFSQEIELI